MRHRTLGVRLRTAARSELLCGALETVGVVLAFVVVGLGCSVLAADGSGRSVYPPPLEAPVDVPDPTEEPAVWLVDGFNVLQAGVLGGRDRSEWWGESRRSELLERASGFDDPSAEIWVVFDGSRPAPEAVTEERPRLRKVFAPSADAWLLARVGSGEEARGVAVVTADRKLAARALHRGARVISPRAFLARCAAGPGGVG